MNLAEAKHAFITGGASGIGLGIADAMVARGIAVTVVDVDQAALDAVQAGRPSERFRTQQLDVRDRAGWARAKAEAETAFGPVDILVNNAGIGPDGSDLADVTLEAFDRIIGINLVGVFNGVTSFAADLRARGRGHIVNTSSVAGLFANAPGVNAYAAAKFGVTAMSETLRAELEPHGVGVSVLCPGYVDTNIIANTARISGETNDYDGGGVPGTPMSTAEVAAIVLHAIEQDEPYTITHPEAWPAVEARMNAIKSAFEAAERRNHESV